MILKSPYRFRQELSKLLSLRFRSQRSPGKRSAPGVLDTHALNSPGAALGLTRATCCVCRLAVCRWENVGRQQSPWVPAFAGMTSERRASKSQRSPGKRSQRSPGKRSAPGALDTHALNSPGAALGLTQATCCVCRLAVCRWENVGRQQSPWVPAFAGMTSERRASKSRASRSEAVNVESGAASVVQ